MRDAPAGQYLRVHYNIRVTCTNNIGDFPGLSNPFWYNPKGASNILSFVLVHKHHLVTYNSKDDNVTVIVPYVIKIKGPK